MKFLALLALTLATAPAFATSQPITEPVTTAHLADILTDSRVAACLQQIRDAADSYTYFVEEVNTLRTGRAIGDTVTTTLNYNLLRGGDMIAGNATLEITEQYFRGMFGPNMPILGVVGCKVTKNIFDPNL